MILKCGNNQEEFVYVLDVLLFASFIWNFDRDLGNFDVDEQFILLSSFLENRFRMIRLIT
jgi:hypothetical protein